MRSRPAKPGTYEPATGGAIGDGRDRLPAEERDAVGRGGDGQQGAQCGRRVAPSPEPIADGVDDVADRMVAIDLPETDLPNGSFGGFDDPADPLVEPRIDRRARLDRELVPQTFHGDRPDRLIATGARLRTPGVQVLGIRRLGPPQRDETMAIG